jgi:P-type conjugative transfer protein TrbJ
MTCGPIRRACIVLGGALVVSTAAPAAFSQIAVFDPSNYAQNVLQAARALEQIQNQIAALQNQAQMLLNQGRNLQPLSFSTLSALQSDMGQVNGLLAQAGRIANDVAAIRGEFDRNYSGSGSDQALGAAATARWQNSLDALRHVLEVQATVANTVAATESQAGQLVEQSQGAAGALQAAQAGNQLLAVQSKQLADLTAILAAQSRAEALEQASQAAAAAEAKARLQRFLATGATP